MKENPAAKMDGVMENRYEPEEGDITQHKGGVYRFNRGQWRLVPQEGETMTVNQKTYKFFSNVGRFVKVYPGTDEMDLYAGVADVLTPEAYRSR